MLLREETYRVQSALAKYCRNGKDIELPGLTPGRLHNYRRLVFNVVEDILRSAFPITYELLGEETWEMLADDFFSNHNCSDPQVMTMPVELYEYVRDHDLALKEQFPYLVDLLYFEWLELEVYLMEDRIFPQVKQEGSRMHDRLAFNPESMIVMLEYPVHRLKGEELLPMKAHYFLLVFREPDTFRVQFFELSVFYAFVLEQMMQQQLPLKDVLPLASEAFHVPVSAEMENRTLQLLADLEAKSFVLGFAS